MTSSWAFDAPLSNATCMPPSQEQVDAAGIPNIAALTKENSNLREFAAEQHETILKLHRELDLQQVQISKLIRQLELRQVQILKLTRQLEELQSQGE